MDELRPEADLGELHAREGGVCRDDHESEDGCRPPDAPSRVLRLRGVRGRGNGRGGGDERRRAGERCEHVGPRREESREVFDPYGPPPRPAPRHEVVSREREHEATLPGGVEGGERDCSVARRIAQEAQEGDRPRKEREPPADGRDPPPAVGPSPHGEEEEWGEKGGRGRALGREESGVQEEHRCEEGRRPAILEESQRRCERRDERQSRKRVREAASRVREEVARGRSGQSAGHERESSRPREEPPGERENREGGEQPVEAEQGLEDGGRCRRGRGEYVRRGVKKARRRDHWPEEAAHRITGVLHGPREVSSVVVEKTQVEREEPPDEERQEDEKKGGAFHPISSRRAAMCRAARPHVHFAAISAAARRPFCAASSRCRATCRKRCARWPGSEFAQQKPL